jgi:hypothetical protein
MLLPRPAPNEDTEMLTRTERRVSEMALLLCAMSVVSACAPQSRTSNELRVEYPLMVNNRTDFEVVVYAMASPTTRGQRLGTARPFASTVLTIPRYALQSQDVFAVELHAIGAVRSVPNWVSHGTVLNESLMAQLDIVGDMSGNLRMSALSSRLAKTYK